ncbi:ABC transporter substrate-binding protein [Vineibacter terrae]|uniref:ABC transporter substrate-binding protein n=1 Tax=Vineibacter terrae TaxID=2586908 RepID=UPI002E38174A|nr:ABC transporter substrate-binding protein [Vineibacter terrae]HEX2890656.1 ABC transporter substrate-binding protein [Vineibacter terrae]
MGLVMIRRVYRSRVRIWACLLPLAACVAWVTRPRAQTSDTTSPPPLAQRLPAVPSVVSTFAGGDGPGRPGGTIEVLAGSDRETRMMTLLGYTRLIAFGPDLALRPDILESYVVEEGRRFTFRLRPGHRWSDGHPFTAEDFRYWWEDVANNRDLNPNGPTVEMLVDGRPPVFEVIDAQTVRFTWHAPNPYFLEAQARALPLFIYRPAHYLRQFHVRYTEPAVLRAAMQRYQTSDWVRLHHRLDQMYVNDNPDMPSLLPWVPRTRPPSSRLVFERNAYYHRIDERGVQLPYIDRVILNVVAPSVIPLKAGTGEADLQTSYLKFDNYTYLKKGSNSFPFEVYLWETGTGSELALYPNFNHADPVLRKLFRDARFRRALSLAIDREEINEAVFLGLAHPSNNTVRPDSALYRREYGEKWTTFDPQQANHLLDELGLVRRGRAIRLRSDGRPLELVVEMSGDTKEQADVLSLIASTWRQVGIKMVYRNQSRDLLRKRVTAGQTMIAVWAGVENAMPTATSSPREFVPATQGDLQWPRWGLYRESNGKAGEACDDPAVQRLIDLLGRWERATDEADQRAVWHELLAAHADQQFTIGVIARSQQPVVVSRRLRNVPRKGIYSWHPGAYFGIYRPDTFWLDGDRPR